MSEPSTLDINSFYYFFSATPQVLASIMGLFSVVAIFKIQWSKRFILRQAEVIQKIIRIGKNKKVSSKMTNNKMLELLDIDIAQESIFNISTDIEFIDNDADEEFKGLILQFNFERVLIKSIIKYIILASIMTAITIFLCLAIIPKGELIMKNPTLLDILYIVTLVSVVACFYVYILTLKICFENKDTDSFLDLKKLRKYIKHNERVSKKKGNWNKEPPVK